MYILLRLFHLHKSVTNRRMAHILWCVPSQRPAWRLTRASGTSCAGKQVRIEECANEDSRFPSWLKPSRTINCLPKISAPTPGRQATVPAVPPLLVMRVLVRAHARTDSPEFLFLRWAYTTSWRTWGWPLGRRGSPLGSWTTGTETWGSPLPPRSSARLTSQKALILGRCTLAPPALLQWHTIFGQSRHREPALHLRSKWYGNRLVHFGCHRLCGRLGYFINNKTMSRVILI